MTYTDADSKRNVMIFKAAVHEGGVINYAERVVTIQIVLNEQTFVGFMMHVLTLTMVTGVMR
jgi:hypothetical protein